MELYDVIYADPPWRYDFSKSDSRKIENHYQTMSIEEICSLNCHAADDSILFLWATAPKIEEALQVIKAWGFTYKTQMIWVKDKIGMGYYFRNKHEILMVGTKGDFHPPEPSRRPPSVFDSIRTKHSKKPFEMYHLIETMYPGMKYYEMFCRVGRYGWATFGNENTQMQHTLQDF